MCNGWGIAVKFLLVDDDVSLLRLMGALLEHAGHEVHLSHAARSAIIDSAEIDFDYLITDLEMLGMDGEELIADIQKELGLSLSKVIVVSGSADAETADRMRGLGIAAFIEKPINPETFATEITRAAAA